MQDYKYLRKLNIGNNAIFYGNFDIDSSPKAVIFNSRQTKTPTGSDLWVVNTVKAIKYAIKHNWLLLTSLDMNTWELPIRACSENGGKQIIIASVKNEDEKEKFIARVTHDFHLDISKTGWLFFQSTEKALSDKADWPLRDKLAVSVADIILPISIRLQGNLDTLIRNQREKKIINDFNAKYKTNNSKQSFNPDEIEPAISNKYWDNVTHWTRTCYGHWPGEKPSSFYNRLIQSQNSYPGNALETLKNILSEMLIRGSSRHLRGDIKGVAFSSLLPSQILPLMRWRKRYVRWGFEPYGIAISRQAAISAGIQPVIYANPDLYDRLLDDDKPYFQNEGEDGAWREEREWRYFGDFDLTKINVDDLRIITFKQSELNIISNITNAEVVSFS